MKPWWQVAVPHKDIREGKIGDFAADFQRILKNEATAEYLDPETFFKRTHFTKGLEKIIRDVLLALSGKDDSKIIQVETPFGGGKTHALVSLYHLIKSSEIASDIPEVKSILKEAGLTNVPKANIAVFVGTVPDPLKGKTPWGEIAEQLGSYEMVKEHDVKRVTPGREILETILRKNQPVLILIDELAEYVVKAKEFEDQVFAFCQELTEAVKSSKQCVLLCTLPSSAPYGERGEKVLAQLQKIFGRMQVIYTPVEGEEIYEILRKRLFEDLGDARVHGNVAQEYFDFYQTLGEEVPREAREVAYKEKIKRAFPFHPELIDVLFERWATLPSFQRTRGALRILAEVVYDLYTREDPSPLIQPCNINLANPRIRRLFIEHIGEVFESVIKSDIAGEGAKAVQIDRNIGTEYAKFKVASGLATAIFFYSFSGGEKKGVTAQRLKLAFLREGIPPAIVGDALRRLEDVDGPLYLHFEKNLYYFSNIVGLNRLIVEREEAIREEEIDEEIKRRIEKLAGLGLKVYLWPRSNTDIPDNKELKLVILPLDMTLKDESTKRFITEVLTKYSTGFRTYKNTLIFLIADPNEYDAVKASVRRFLALNAIKEDKEKMKILIDEDKQRVEQRLEDATTSTWSKIISVYRYLAKASREEFETFDMGIPIIDESLTLSKRVKDFLRDQEILLNNLAPKVVLEKIFPKDENQKSLAEIWEAFLKYPELPMLESENVLKNTIAQGVQNGVFGVSIGGRVRYLERIPTEDLTDDAIVIRKELAEKMKGETEKITSAQKMDITSPIVKSSESPLAKSSEKEPLPSNSIRRVKLTAQVPWDKLSEMMRGVFAPLRQEGARILPLEIKIEAESEKGISKDTLDLKIRETLQQIGAKIIEEETE